MWIFAWSFSAHLFKEEGVSLITEEGKTDLFPRKAVLTSDRLTHNMVRNKLQRLRPHPETVAQHLAVSSLFTSITTSLIVTWECHTLSFANVPGSPKRLSMWIFAWGFVPLQRSRGLEDKTGLFHGKAVLTSQMAERNSILNRQLEEI